MPLASTRPTPATMSRIYAWGPWAHLFDGVVEQNLIYHVMAHATGLPEKAVLAGLSN